MDIEAIRVLVVDIASRRMLLVDSGKPRVEIQKFLVELSLNYRLYMLNVTAANELWARIRNDNEVFHFIISSTNELIMRMDNGSQDLARLAETISYSLGAMASGKTSVIDKGTLERLAQVNELKTLLNDNPWLIFVILLESLNDPIEQPARRK